MRIEGLVEQLNNFEFSNSSLENQIRFCELGERFFPLFREMKNSLKELQSNKRKQFEKQI